MKFITLAFLTLLSTQVHALPLGAFDALEVSNNDQTELDPKYDFNGIVKLSNCSGSIIHFSGMPDSARAIAMTNGHCLGSFGGMLKPGEAVVGKKVSRKMKVYNKSQKLIPINATKILYATMSNTDLALYELDETYQDLKLKGVDSFLLDSIHPTLGTSIDIVSGYWDRGYRCEIEAFVFKLKEADWTMLDSIRYSSEGCNTIGGTSGSPIIETGTRIVVGINNTGNENGERCTMNNPCEVDEEGKVVVKPHASYGQETYNINTCLTPDFRIDLNVSGCDLYKPNIIPKALY